MADFIESVTETLFSNIINIPVVRANQNGPRPKLPYASYQITACKTVGSDEYGEIDDDGVIQIKGVREGTIMVNFFGADAKEIAGDLVNCIKKISSRELMRKLKLVISNTGNVSDITALRDDMHFETMANVELTFRYTCLYTDHVGIIETVDAASTVGKEPIHQVITID
ncbi:hypothetical protein PMPD1_1732 [Paramixta manurensis]|uniref:Phage neck terminator protein gp12-like domain-containing protein n=1 Tax=Paramixta manurensis TaxID=2740817 RepID=A0A6M8UIN3_9GAMM|nr:hypothetical protein PMPD1_1732 [Erwiniaceae bacterium PD-1]